MRRISQILFIPLAGNSGHSSKQSTRGLMTPFEKPAERAARSTPYLILLRGGFTLHASFQPRRWSLTPPFHYHRPEGLRYLFSVALSIAHGCHAPSALDKRILCPAESGLSSASRQRPVTRTSLQEKISKISGKECARTSCTRRCSGTGRPRQAFRWRRPSGKRSAAGRGGSHRTLRPW